MGIKIGERMCVFRGTSTREDGTQILTVFGFGVCTGQEIPPPGIMFMGSDLHEVGHENPKIVLDSGKVVWGCESWVRLETEGRKIIEQFPGEVVFIDIEEARRRRDERNADSEKGRGQENNDGNTRDDEAQDAKAVEEKGE